MSSDRSVLMAITKIGNGYYRLQLKFINIYKNMPDSHIPGNVVTGIWNIISSILCVYMYIIKFYTDKRA